MAAYYNEIDEKAAAWLRELIRRDLIAPGDVDTRSIEDVRPDDLAGYTQCHFFAGIGVWSYALRRAGWADDRPVWTGSCPCQPFSAAGAGAAFADERHLWPAFYWLIGQRRPPVVFGEQVASKAADDWIDLVSADLEAVGYAVAAVAFPSAGVGAPHIRDRDYWVADASSDGRREHAEQHGGAKQSREPAPFGHDDAGRRDAGGVADTIGADNRGEIKTTDYGKSKTDRSTNRVGGRSGASGGLGPADGPRRQSGHVATDEPAGGVEQASGDARLADANSRQRDGLPELRGAERDGPDAGRAEGGGRVAPRSDIVGLADDDDERLEGRRQPGRERAAERPAGAGGVAGGLADTESAGGRADDRTVRRREGERLRDAEGQDAGGAEQQDGRPFDSSSVHHPGPVNGLWRDADWLFCRDGKWRPVEPGTFPLAHGAPARVGRLRGYGNAINAEAAVQWIESYLDTKAIDETQGA